MLLFKLLAEEGNKITNLLKNAYITNNIYYFNEVFIIIFLFLESHFFIDIYHWN